MYLDVKLSDPSVGTEDPTKSINEAFQNTTSEDNTTPYIVLEQHTYLDLDQDGYSEPYIVTVELDSHKVLRIIPRFNGDSVIVDEK